MRMVMRAQWLATLLAAAMLVVAAPEEAAAQGERFVGVRKDAKGDVILFAIDGLGGAERRVATLHKAADGIQLLGITTLNQQRGAFSYAYASPSEGKEFMHTVAVLTGETLAKVALPSDVSGIEVLTESTAAVRGLQAERDALARRIETLEREVRRLQALEQDVRRLQSDVRLRLR
jgi:hypothetical protein